MVKRSRLAPEPSSSPFDFPLDVLGQGKLPRRIFRVPDDQEKLLRASTSWAEDLFRSPQGLANVPGKVLENLFDFHSRKLEEPELQSSAIPNQSPNALHRKPAGVPSSPLVPRLDLAHEDDNDNSPPGTPISGWDSSPPPVARSEPPEESDEQVFASQLPEAPAALMQLASSPGDSGSRRDQSSLEQPFETQLPARPPLEAGPAISNLQKRPVFNDFPSSSPAMDEELEIVQPAAYDKEMMPPPPHKAIEPNPTPPSAQQVQVPSTFPEPQSSKSVPQLPKVKAARKHRVQPQKAVDVRGLLTDELPTAKPLQTTGLRAPPPKPRPQTCVPESSFSDDASSSVVVPSTEHHKTLRTPSKTTNGLSPKTLVRETQPPLAFKQTDRLSQSPKSRPPTSRSLPEIAQTVISSSHGQTPSAMNQLLAFSPHPPTFAPLPAPQAILPAPSSTAPVPASFNGDSKPRPDDSVVQPLEENGTHDQQAPALKERLAGLEDQLKQARLNVAYYEAQARSVFPSSAVQTAGGSKPTVIADPPAVPEEDAMVVDEVPQQLEMAENNPEHTPFHQYTNAYPAYKHHGDIWEFVKACVYIQQLQRNRALATYQYDDFIRAWTEGFVPYVHGFDTESSKKPLTAIEWYMETVDNVRFQFRKGIVTRENLETVFEKHPAEANEARKHLRAENHKKEPPRSSLPPANPVLALPPTPTPVISTAHLLEEGHVGPEEQTEGEKEAAIGTDPTTLDGHPQAQQQLRGSQSDPVDGSIAEARKPKSLENTLRRSTSGTVPSKRKAVDELVAASPKRTASRVLSSRQSGHSTPSATLQPSSTASRPPRSSAPWLGPRRHANDVDKRAKAFKKYIDKEKRRQQESIVDSSAPLGGTPTSGQRE
ncbi:hypothetical protein PG996_005431 [Apiospora saccharicola]|uniref:Uncharacterized protein n=1 Tax=Apiospora saccharicola TaxID=335842 RepID=A0ABR1VLJ9_9PEZI